MSERHDRGAERRRYRRYRTPDLRVDYSVGDHFLFAPIENLSEMGIFIRTEKPHAVGTTLRMAFALEGGAERLALDGRVVWVQDPSRGAPDSPPGMGVRFLDLDAEQRALVLDLVNRVAYLQ